MPAGSMLKSLGRLNESVPTPPNKEDLPGPITADLVQRAQAISAFEHYDYHSEFDKGAFKLVGQDWSLTVSMNSHRSATSTFPLIRNARFGRGSTITFGASATPLHVEENTTRYWVVLVLAMIGGSFLWMIQAQ